METVDLTVDCLQQLTWMAMAISLSGHQTIKVLALYPVGSQELPWRSSQSCPPDELLTEFTTSPHVAVKGFSLCSFVKDT